jgi:glycerol-3-phosphate dehydrogenase
LTLSAESWRQEAFERLGAQRFDLLVIGAGIVGSRIAYEAASDGLSVALIDAGDFGGATSSSSSKLLHGGLRYLARAHFGLVRALHAERRAVATRIAPHLVTPLPLLLAVEGRSRVLAAKLNLALPLYAALGGWRRPLPRHLALGAAAALIPALRVEALGSCGIVTEALTHDARLTLATVTAAASAGASVINRVRLVELECVRGRIAAALVEDALTGERLQLRCRALVNATGPWLDELRKLEDAHATPLVRLSKGVHVILPLLGDWQSGLALFDDSATTIAVPWQGMLLLGATDTPYEASVARLRVTSGDVQELLDRFADVLPRDQLRAGRVVHSFVGLRVLARGDNTTAREPRRHVLSVGPAGMVSIAGGKLTTHRLIASDALRHLPTEVRPRRRHARNEPLGYRCSRATEAFLRTRLDHAATGHLARLYGEAARSVIAYADRSSDALERIHPDGPDLWAQVDFARDQEWALTVADVIERRTTVAVRGLTSERVVGAVGKRLASGDGSVWGPRSDASSRLFTSGSR